MGRTISFYYLELTRQSDSKAIPLTEAYDYIYSNKLKDVDGEGKAITIKNNDNEYTVQILKKERDFVFIKIGRRHPANTLEVRDKRSLKTGELQIKPNQEVEVFTLCLVNLLTGIVCHISMSGAPRVRLIRELFLQYDKDGKNPCVDLATIYTKDVIERIAKKGIVHSIECTVAVPLDEVLSNDLGVSEKTFDECENVKTTTVTYKIVAENRKTLFNKQGIITGLINEVKEKAKKSNHKLVKMLIKAKNNSGEALQVFDINETAFTLTVDIKKNDSKNVSQEELMEILKSKYEENKEDIMSCIKL